MHLDLGLPHSVRDAAFLQLATNLKAINGTFPAVKKMAAMTSRAQTSASADSTVCVVLQQCLSAKLQLNASDDKSSQDLPVYVEVGSKRNSTNTHLASYYG